MTSAANQYHAVCVMPVMASELWHISYRVASGLLPEGAAMVNPVQAMVDLGSIDVIPGVNP